jgi:hypothetical protein
MRGLMEKLKRALLGSPDQQSGGGERGERSGREGSAVPVPATVPVRKREQAAVERKGAQQDATLEHLQERLRDAAEVLSRQQSAEGETRR